MSTVEDSFGKYLQRYSLHMVIDRLTIMFYIKIILVPVQEVTSPPPE